MKNVDGQSAAVPPPTVTVYDKLGNVLFMRNNAFVYGVSMRPRDQGSYNCGAKLADTFTVTGRQADTLCVRVSQGCIYCSNSGAQYRLRCALADSKRSNETEPSNIIAQARATAITTATITSEL